MADGVSDAVEHARRCFLRDDNRFGCAELTFLALTAAFGLEPDRDSSVAMALNGGVAYSGGPCGAITGAGLALGLLAGRRIRDHAAAKAAARALTASLLDAFRHEHGAVDCRDLIGLDLRTPGGHEAFIRSGIWRERCMGQIEFAVRAVAPLADADEWDRAMLGVERHEG